MNYKAMLQQLGEFGADPLQLLQQAEEIRVAAISDGVVSDKVHQKEGVVECNERSALTAATAVRLKFDIVKWVTAQAEANSQESVECRLVITGLDMTPPGELQHYGA